jgi:hypothetical protein
VTAASAAAAAAGGVGGIAVGGLGWGGCLREADCLASVMGCHRPARADRHWHEKGSFLYGLRGAGGRRVGSGAAGTG